MFYPPARLNLFKAVSVRSVLSKVISSLEIGRVFSVLALCSAASGSLVEAAFQVEIKAFFVDKKYTLSFHTLACFKVPVGEINISLWTKTKKMRSADFGCKAVLFSKSTLCRNLSQLKGPKCEIFDSGVFAQIRPIWIGDLGTRPKNY